MVEEVVIRIRKCDECPFMQLMFTYVSMAVMVCELASDEGSWYLGGGIPPWCPFREGSNVREKNREPRLVSHQKRR